MDKKSHLEVAEKIKLITRRSNTVSNSLLLNEGDFKKLLEEKDEIHFINGKAKAGSKDVNYYAFNKRDYSSLNQLLNNISIQESRLMENSECLEGIKCLNRNVWFDISRKSNAIEGIFEDFDFALIDFRKQLRGKFIISDPVDVDNFDYLEYFKQLRERENQITENNDSVILSVVGKKKTHKLSLETVRHYIAFKYAQRCALFFQRNEMTSSNFIEIIDNVAGLLSGNDIVANRNVLVGVNGNIKLANWKPVPENEIYNKMKVLSKWVITEGSTKLSPLEQAAIFHAEFIRIHPYLDGNGRISRIMSNFILMQNGMPTVALKHNRSEKYFNAINKAIETHDIDDLIGIFYTEAIKSAKNIKESLDYIENTTLNLTK